MTAIPRRRASDAHADLRIKFEADCDLLLDALEQHDDHGIDAELLRRVIARAQASRKALSKYERAHGIEIGRADISRTLSDFIDETLALEHGGAASHGRQVSLLTATDSSFDVSVAPADACSASSEANSHRGEPAPINGEVRQ